MEKKVSKFIEDNDLVTIQLSPASEQFDLWECPGGHVWTWDCIVSAIRVQEKSKALGIN